MVDPVSVRPTVHLETVTRRCKTAPALQSASKVEPASDPQAAYRAYGPALVRKAERMLRSREDAVDVVHGLFADLIPRWTKDVDLPYLYRAVTNRCLNLVRDRDTRARLLAREPTAAAPVGRVQLDDQVVGLGLIAAHLSLSRKTIGKRLDRIREEVIALRGDGRREGQAS